MANAAYTLIMDGQKHGFRMEDVDFSAPARSMAYGLGETVVDSIEWQGLTEAEVTVENADATSKRYGFHVTIHPEVNREAQIMEIGHRLALATYKALEGAAA